MERIPPRSSWPPTGHRYGKRATTDILVLAFKGRAFRCLGTLLIRQGGQQVLYGSALAVAATIQTWSADTDTPVADLTTPPCTDLNTTTIRDHKATRCDDHWNPPEENRTSRGQIS
ncbi:MAG: hypothetical protein JO296_10990 [Pseudonocardiales bacterium]|nr:hypothetical protein [Pseudonocardiales bacterium]